MLQAIFLAASIASGASMPITGPTQAKAGEIIVLDASKAAAKSYAWAATPKTFAGRPTILPLGAKCVVCSAPGVYHVFLALGDDNGVTLHEWIVTVTERAPSPGPGPSPHPPSPPSPGPGPTPPAPNPAPTPPAPGKLGLTKLAFDEAVKLPAAAKAKAAEVARAFRGLASAMQAGGLSLWQVPIETAKAFDAAVADQKAAWLPASKTMQTELRRLNKEGKITTLPQLAEAYVEIATGLEAAGN